MQGLGRGDEKERGGCGGGATAAVALARWAFSVRASSHMLCFPFDSQQGAGGCRGQCSRPRSTNPRWWTQRQRSRRRRITGRCGERNHKALPSLWSSGGSALDICSIRFSAGQHCGTGTLNAALCMLRRAAQALRNNETLPLVFFDVSIRGVPKGRIEMVLFPHISPRAAENFRWASTPEGQVQAEWGRVRTGIESSRFYGRSSEWEE